MERVKSRMHKQKSEKGGAPEHCSSSLVELILQEVKAKQTVVMSSTWDAIICSGNSVSGEEHTAV